MDYCYLRDEDRNALVTIGYQTVENTTYYGIMVVSGQEPVVDKLKGRNRATSRCKEAMRTKEVARWQDYYINEVVSNQFRNSFINYLLTFGFEKCGHCDDVTFKETLDKLIVDYKENPFGSKQDALNATVQTVL